MTRADRPAPDLPKRSVLSRTVAGMGWIVGWRMATRLIGLASTLVLVRLLAPTDFGLVALGTTFVVAVDTLSTLGVEDALVRDHAPTRAMYDTAFTLTMLRTLLTAVIIAAAAIPIGAFFAEPRLAYILWALALGLVIAGCGSMGPVDFRRNLDFGQEFMLQIVPRIASVAVTIGAALFWQSYWALICGILAGRTVRTLFSYQRHPWRPRLSLSAWRGLLAFSSWSWAISMAELVRDRMDTFVVGRVLDPAAVGVYAIGEEVALLPTSELVLPLCRACFSGFVAARGAGEGMTETFMRPVATTFLVTLPAGLGISLVADPLVRLVVGAQWVGAIPVIEILGVVGGFAVFGYVASTLLSVHAHLRQRFAITVVSLVMRFAMILPLITRFGIAGAAVGTLAGMLLEHAIIVTVAFRRFALCPWDLLSRIWRIIAAGAAMSGVLFSSGLGWVTMQSETSAMLHGMAVSVVMGALVYGVTLAGLWLLSGRPPGAEADMAAFVFRALRALTRRRHPVLPL